MEQKNMICISEKNDNFIFKSGGVCQQVYVVISKLNSGHNL